MEPAARLAAIHAIKQLKARYFYAYDHKDWAMWRDEVWAPDGRLEIPEIDTVIAPRETMIAWVAERAADQVSVHHGHTPIIEITSDTSATGIWAMEDRLYRSREHPLHDGSHVVIGFGHYHETYVKLEAGWRIRSTRLTRLHSVHTTIF